MASESQALTVNDNRLWSQPIPIFIVLAILTVILYWSMFEYANYKWSSDDNYQHGYLVPFASAYLIWRNRKRLKATPLAGSKWGLAFIAVGLVIHLLGIRSDLLRLSMLSFIPYLYGLVLLFAGWRWLYILLFPIGYLIFAFPQPLYIESITFPMKLAVAKVSSAIMDSVGMRNFREGTMIHLPQMSMGVADACSGLRSLVLVTAVAAFYAYVYMPTQLLRIVFFLLSIPIALVANVFRILITGVVGYFWGAGELFDFVHDVSGLLVLVVAGAILVMVDSLLIRIRGRKKKKKGSGKTDASTEEETTVQEPSAQQMQMHVSPTALGSLFAMLILSVFYVYWPQQAQAEHRMKVLSRIPNIIGEWTSAEEIRIPREQQLALGADEYIMREYTKDGKRVLLYVAFFTAKHGTLTHNPERCYPGSGYTVTRKRFLGAKGASEQEPFQAIRIVPVKDQNKLVVLYWFQEGEQVVVDKWQHVRKVLTQAILYNRTESLMVRLSTSIATESEIEEKTQMLKEFGKMLRGEVGKVLESKNE